MPLKKIPEPETGYAKDDIRAYMLILKINGLIDAQADLEYKFNALLERFDRLVDDPPWEKE